MRTNYYSLFIKTLISHIYSYIRVEERKTEREIEREGGKKMMNNLRKMVFCVQFLHCRNLKYSYLAAWKNKKKAKLSKNNNIFQSILNERCVQCAHKYKSIKIMLNNIYGLWEWTWWLSLLCACVCVCCQLIHRLIKIFMCYFVLLKYNLHIKKSKPFIYHIHSGSLSHRIVQNAMKRQRKSSKMMSTTPVFKVK